MELTGHRPRGAAGKRAGKPNRYPNKRLRANGITHFQRSGQDWTAPACPGQADRLILRRRRGTGWKVQERPATPPEHRELGMTTRKVTRRKALKLGAAAGALPLVHVSTAGA